MKPCQIPLPQLAGLLVQNIAAGSPYAKLGLQPGYVDIQIDDEELTLGGDIILEVGGMLVPADIDEFRAFNTYISSLKKGDTLTVKKILRAEQILALSSRI